MTITIRDAERTDLVAVAGIERVSFSDPWTRGMFAAHLAPREGAVFLIAEDANETVAYALAQTVIDESELLNVAVSPNRRNQGIGARLLDAMVDRCRRAGAAFMWLEVRGSNGGARALYASRGFVAVGLRKRYYESPREDAIVLRADLHMPMRDESVIEPAGGLVGRRNETILSTASQHPRQETK